MPRSAVVLLSGGMDSTVSLAWAVDQGFAVHALSVDYGQRHRVELEAAKAVAKHYAVTSHRVVKLDLRAIGGSALTADIAVPQDRAPTDMAASIPVTYVPARNTILLSLCLGLAEVVDAEDLVLGVNAIDYSGYPDCRPAFLGAFATLASLATKAGVEGRARYQIHAPLLTLGKAEIVSMGRRLGVPFELTHTCYAPDPDGSSCGRCDACRLRLLGFAEAGIQDPIRYRPAD